MPLYEFKCPDCSTENTDRIYEVLMSCTDISEVLKCPDCEAILIKQISTSNFKVN